MSIQTLKNKRADKRKKRVRGKIFGTALRPRLTVFRSNAHTYLQVINDEQGVTLAAASDLGRTGKKAAVKKDRQALAGTKSERSAQLAKEIVSELKSKKVNKLVFDRGSYRYHGRLKVIADTLRSEGIEV